MTKAISVGTVQLKPDIVLKDALYVPVFQFNLVSIRQLCIQNNLRAIFYADDCICRTSCPTK